MVLLRRIELRTPCLKGRIKYSVCNAFRYFDTNLDTYSE